MDVFKELQTFQLGLQNLAELFPVLGCDKEISNDAAISFEALFQNFNSL